MEEQEYNQKVDSGEVEIVKTKKYTEPSKKEEGVEEYIDVLRKAKLNKHTLPIFTSVPTHKALNGEYVWVDDGTNYMLYTYQDSAWRLVGTDIVDKIDSYLPSDKDLVGYWDFNEGQGAIAYDGSGNGNDGTLHNMEVGDWVDGPAGGALDFGGTNEYIDIPIDTTLNLTGNFSITLWLKYATADQGGGYPPLIKNVDGNSRISIQVDGPADKIYFNVTDTAGNTTGSELGSNLGDNAWHFVSLVRNGEDVLWYEDGVLIKTKNVSGLGATAFTTDWMIAWFTAGNYYIGEIDEVRVYKGQVLTAKEIYALYKNPTSGAIANNRVVKTEGAQTINGVKTFGSFLKTPSSVPTTAYQVANKKYVDYIVGNYLLFYSHVDEKTTSASFTKIKEITLRKTGDVRISFDLQLQQASGNAQARGRIYKNGVAVGTERANDINDTDWHTYSEDLTGFSAGDLIQIYAKVTIVAAGREAHIKNSKIMVGGTEQTGEAVGYISGNGTLEASADTARSTAETSYTLLKEIIAGADGYLRIKFSINAGSPTSTMAYAKIYRNDTAVGTERSTAANAWTEYSEDLFFKRDDKIQLYAKTADNSSYVKEFRVYTNDWSIETD